jgi:hypothetical protein
MQRGKLEMRPEPEDNKADQYKLRGCLHKKIITPREIRRKDNNFDFKHFYVMFNYEKV